MVSCPTEIGRDIIHSMVGLQLTQLSGNCALRQHVVHHNYISCQKKTTFVGTHDWTLFINKLLIVTWISAHVWSFFSAQGWKLFSFFSFLLLFFAPPLRGEEGDFWFISYKFISLVHGIHPFFKYVANYQNVS